MTTTILTVSGISNGHWRSSIGGAVEEFQSLDDVTVNLKSKTVEVSCDDS